MCDSGLGCQYRCSGDDEGGERVVLRYEAKDGIPKVLVKEIDVVDVPVYGAKFSKRVLDCRYTNDGSISAIESAANVWGGKRGC